jgi:hypothetical protein
MDKVGIAGNRVDLAARGLKVIVFARQVFQLGGADKSKVRGVKEKDAPMPENIGLGHGFERVVLKSLDGKIAHFFLNHGHGNASLR